MNTTLPTPEDGRRRRRKHSPEFKAHVVAACCTPGVWMAAVALANGVKAKLVRRWVVEADAGVGMEKPPRALATSTKTLAPVSTNFVAVQLPAAAACGTEIRVKLERGATKVVVIWPTAAAEECAAWMRELLR